VEQRATTTVLCRRTSDLRLDEINASIRL